MQSETPSTNGPENTQASANDTPPPKPGRRADGKFAPGNPGGPGNPFGRKVAALRRAFCAAVQPDELQAILQLFTQKAIAGDKEAAKLVLSYVLGRPGGVPDPDRLDLEEWRQHLCNPVTAQALEKVCGALPHAAVLRLFRELGPTIAQQHVQSVLPPYVRFDSAAAAPSTNGAPEGQTPPTEPSPIGDQTSEADSGAPSTNRGAAASPAARPIANGFARTQAVFREALVDAVSNDDLEQIAQRLRDDAGRGDLRAAQLLFRYVVGAPAVAADPDAVDLDEWRLYQASALTFHELERALQYPSHAEGCALARQLQPDAAQAFAAQAAAG